MQARTQGGTGALARRGGETNGIGGCGRKCECKCKCKCKCQCGFVSTSTPRTNEAPFRDPPVIITIRLKESCETPSIHASRLCTPNHWRRHKPGWPSVSQTWRFDPVRRRSRSHGAGYSWHVGLDNARDTERGGLGEFVCDGEKWVTSEGIVRSGESLAMGEEDMGMWMGIKGRNGSTEVKLMTATNPQATQNIFS